MASMTVLRQSQLPGPESQALPMQRLGMTVPVSQSMTVMSPARFPPLRSKPTGGGFRRPRREYVIRERLRGL